MKTLKIFFGVGALVALLGLNVALADIKSESAAQPTFSLYTGDGTSLSPITFDVATNNEAQTTCAMTPGSPSLSPLLPEPVVPLQATEQLTQYNDMSSVGSQEGGSNYNPPPQPYRRDLPPPPRNDGPPSEDQVVTPEPATMLLIGLGIGGVAVAARRRWKKNGR